MLGTNSRLTSSTGPVLQKGAVDVSAAFEQQRADAEMFAEQIHGLGGIDRGLARRPFSLKREWRESKRRKRLSIRLIPSLRDGPSG